MHSIIRLLELNLGIYRFANWAMNSDFTAQDDWVSIVNFNNLLGYQLHGFLAALFQ